MKITVCFKALADYARMSHRDWKWDERHFVDMSFVRRVFNCFDESALEMALKLCGSSESLWGKAEITALTVDDPQGDIFLKHLIAVGYDHVVRIQCNPGIDLRFNPLAISRMIAAYIKQKAQQLVILGMQGGEGDNRQTGLLVAERLKWPCIREVTKAVRTTPSDCLKVTSRIDGAALVQTVKLPLVLIIGQSLDSPFLRFPTLRQKLTAQKKQITVLSSKALGTDNGALSSNDKTLIGLQKSPQNQPCHFIEGQSPREQSENLYDRYLKERLAR